jgi:hypothetical protein
VEFQVTFADGSIVGFGNMKKLGYNAPGTGSLPLCRSSPLLPVAVHAAATAFAVVGRVVVVVAQGFRGTAALRRGMIS